MRIFATKNPKPTTPNPTKNRVTQQPKTSSKPVEKPPSSSSMSSVCPVVLIRLLYQLKRNKQLI